MEKSFNEVLKEFKENNYICEDNWCNNELKEILEVAKEKGYKYIVKANDKMLSGWGCARNRKHIQLILCKTPQERLRIYNDVSCDNSFNYANWYSINDWETIRNLTYKYSYTIRNDWKRGV